MIFFLYCPPGNFTESHWLLWMGGYLICWKQMPLKNKVGRSRANQWQCWEPIQRITSLIIAIKRKRVTRDFFQMMFFLVLDILWFVACAVGAVISFGLYALLSIIRATLEDECSISAEGSCHCSGENDIPMNCKPLIHNVFESFWRRLPFVVFSWVEYVHYRPYVTRWVLVSLISLKNITWVLMRSLVIWISLRLPRQSRLLLRVIISFWYFVHLPNDVLFFFFHFEESLHVEDK